MSGHLLPNATEHPFCCDIAFTDDSPASPKLLVQEAHMKIDDTASEALLRLQRELCAFEKQVHSLCESVQAVIVTTSETQTQLRSPQQEREAVIRIAEGVVSRLKVAPPTTIRREKYLREREVAEYMGVKVSTLRAWRLRQSKNGPPFARLGRMILYSVSELEKHLAANAIPYRD
jgi:DNA-binding transcriptional regulator YiaG